MVGNKEQHVQPTKKAAEAERPAPHPGQRFNDWASI